MFKMKAGYIVKYRMSQNQIKPIMMDCLKVENDTYLGDLIDNKWFVCTDTTFGNNSIVIPKGDYVKVFNINYLEVICVPRDQNILHKYMKEFEINCEIDNGYRLIRKYR